MGAAKTTMKLLGVDVGPDRLALEGVRFTDAHSSSGVCTPSYEQVVVKPALSFFGLNRLKDIFKHLFAFLVGCPISHIILKSCSLFGLDSPGADSTIT